MVRLLLVAVLAASAGIHLALAGEHGASFHVAAALLALAAAVLCVRPRPATAFGAAALLTGLLAAYALDHGLDVDGVAGVTKLAETVGLVCAIRLSLVSTPRGAEWFATLVLAGMIAALAAAITPTAAHEQEPPTASHGH